MRQPRGFAGFPFLVLNRVCLQALLSAPASGVDDNPLRRGLHPLSASRTYGSGHGLAPPEAGLCPPPTPLARLPPTQHPVFQLPNASDFGFHWDLINRVGASGGGKLTNRAAAVHRLSACVQVCFPRPLASAIRRRMTVRSWLFYCVAAHDFA